MTGFGDGGPERAGLRGGPEKETGQASWETCPVRLVSSAADQYRCSSESYSLESYSLESYSLESYSLSLSVPAS